MYDLLKKIGVIFRILPKPIRNFIFEITSNYSNFLALAVRYIILSSFVKSIGERVYIGKNVTIRNPENLTIGNSVSIHDNCYLDAFGSIELGNYVSIANHSSLISFEHTWGDNDVPIKYNPSIKKSISISDDVWIGSGCRVLGGTNVGRRVIIAAGAVAKGELSESNIYGGVPTRIIKKL